MTHSIEELERQFDLAESAVDLACQKFREARNRLLDARCRELAEKLAARGITPGTKVTDGKGVWGYMGTAPSDIFLRPRATVILHQVRKDGTISKRRLRPFGVVKDELRPVKEGDE